MKLDDLSLRQIQEVVDRLGGIPGVKRFLDGELLVVDSSVVWKTWKTITLGYGFQTHKELCSTLREHDIDVPGWEEVLQSALCSPERSARMEVDLASVAVGDLGFRHGATRADIHRRAQHFGLRLCPPDLAPQLRRQYPDQPHQEWLQIGMHPVVDTYGGHKVFAVGHDTTPRLSEMVDGYPESQWYEHNRFVFMLRQRKLNS